VKISKEFKIGLLAIVSLLILYFGVNFLKGQDFLSPTQSYYVFYSNVNGLGSSNQVLMDGYKIGIVGEMEIFQKRKSKVLVELKINREIILGKDARALLIDTDFLGGKAITVFPGDIQNPAEPEDTILGNVQKSLAEEFAERAMPVVQSFDTTILGINEFFSDYSSLSEKLEISINRFSTLVYNLNTVTVENRQNIKRSFSNLDSVMADLALAVSNFSSLSSKLNQIADSMSAEELSASLRSMRANLENMQIITERMAMGEGTLGKLSAEDSLYRNLNSAIMDLDSLLLDLRENPKRYVRLSLF
jgi:phospholipid/cholesterol/gamma-HCH transport system substrate-binding protein